MSEQELDDRVTVARGLRGYEAEALQRELEAHEIESWYLDTSHTEQISGTGLAPMGRLLVLARDEKRATEILSEFEHRRPSDAPEEKEWRSGLELEKAALRALRASIAGVLCAPYAIHLYSMGLLIGMRPDFGRLTPRGRRAFWGAAVVNAGVFVSAAVLAWMGDYPWVAGLLLVCPLMILWVGLGMVRKR